MRAGGPRSQDFDDLAIDECAKELPCPFAQGTFAVIGFM
jgi:hypothetical protein